MIFLSITLKVDLLFRRQIKWGGGVGMGGPKKAIRDCNAQLFCEKDFVMEYVFGLDGTFSSGEICRTWISYT